ncbi:hypothetical protein MTO96_034940 [Rhipicephalus appendiculatus]
MVSSTVALHALVVAVLAVITCSGEEQVPVLGGWQKHNVGDDAIYEELAHFAVSKQVANREFFDTVLEIVDVESQVRIPVQNQDKLHDVEHPERSH